MRTHNWVKCRTVRFVIVGWTLQAVHVLDRTEKLFHIAFEGLLFVVSSVLYY
jgi:hypothetical protein